MTTSGPKLVPRALGAMALATVLLGGAGCSSGSSDDKAADGPVTIAATDGGSDGPSTTVAGGAGAIDLPVGWPEELALPDGLTAIEAGTQTNSMRVVANGSGDLQGAFDAIKAQLTDAGWEIVNAELTPSEQGGYGAISATSDELTAAIVLGPDPTGKIPQVQINLAETR
ncbi:MAG: hypothetical protein JWM47_1525 [Acidimicrobiales bacterium]|nr:hypothetical protein [Acidimicrobiales bacterium]